MVGLQNGRIAVTVSDSVVKSIPAETVESIVILGRSQLTTQCVEYCLSNGKGVSYLSKGGRYYGRLQSQRHVNVFRQRKQCQLYDTEFGMQFARNVITAKLHNEYVVLKRYERSRGIQVPEAEKMLNICRNKVQNVDTIQKMIGYEGVGAKYYLEGLSECVEEPFRFQGRSRRPPLDPFNSMLSLGYTLLHNIIISEIEQKGLNPYMGFIHRNSSTNPSLASDLIEEWRPVLVDSLVMSLINGKEIYKSHFQEEGEDGVFLTKEGMRIFLNKMEMKLSAQMGYLDYVDYKVDFRGAIALQLNQLVKAIEAEDAKLYRPIWIR